MSVGVAVSRLVRRPVAGHGRALAIVVGCAVALAVVAGVVGSRFASPRQIAASASSPPIVRVTQPVSFGILHATVAIRGSVVDPDPVAVGLPDDLGTSLPVITSVNANVGSTVSEGEVLFSVAQRPVVVLKGAIPAFRDMAPGDNGVDVTQLQGALHTLGYSTAPDPTGIYGPGTSAAVAAWYSALDYPAEYSPANAQAQLAQLTSAVVQATSKLDAANAALASAKASSTETATVPADETAVTSAQAALQQAKTALVTGHNTMGAMVPRGEVVFVPSLPESVVSSQVALGAQAPTKGAVMDIGSGALALQAQVGAGELSSLHVGQRATATSDLTGKSFPATVASVATTPSTPNKSTSGTASNVPTYAVDLTPTGAVPPQLLGQNVAVVIQVGSTKTPTWIVPASAVTTTASGTSFVTVAAGHRQGQVDVEPGLVSGGREAVTATNGHLHKGESVVIGIASSGS